MGILGAGRPTGSQRRGASGWSRAQPTDHGCNYQQLSELLAEREGLALARSSVRRILLDAGIATPWYRQRHPRHPRGEARADRRQPAKHAGWARAVPHPRRGDRRCDQRGAGGTLPPQRGCPRLLPPAALPGDDRQGIFPPKPKRAWSGAEQLAGQPAPTPFAAQSPQAKGRIERLFGTVHDRLVIELRLAGAATRAETNQVRATFLPTFNARFRVPATAAGTA
jgi:hypothetical protein